MNDNHTTTTTMTEFLLSPFENIALYYEEVNGVKEYSIHSEMSFNDTSLKASGIRIEASNEPDTVELTFVVSRDEDLPILEERKIIHHTKKLGALNINHQEGWIRLFVEVLISPASSGGWSAPFGVPNNPMNGNVPVKEKKGEMRSSTAKQKI